MELGHFCRKITHKLPLYSWSFGQRVQWGCKIQTEGIDWIDSLRM
jgi:hypothetical protein